MILTAIDTYISNRLKKIKVNGVAVTVYGPGDVRDFGRTSIVCFAISRISGLQVSRESYVHWMDVFTPSAASQTTTIPETGIYGPWIEEHGNTLTGPASWTARKFPIPTTVDYQIDVLATKITHRDLLEMALAEAMPYVLRATIEGQNIQFLEDEYPLVLDDLEAPLYRTAHRYTASNIWVSRTPSQSVGSIEFDGLTTEMEATNDLES